MKGRKLTDDQNFDFSGLLNKLVAQVFPCGPDDIEHVAQKIGVDGKME